MDRLTVADVLAELERGAPGLIELVCGSPEREVRASWLAENLRDLDDCPPHALVVLTRAASRDAQGYRLDVALRRMGGVAGLVLQSDAPPPSLSALALARREDLPLVRLTRPTDVTSVLGVAIRMLDTRLPLLLESAVGVCRAVDRLESQDVDGADLLVRSGAAELFGLALGPRDSSRAGIPAVLTDRDGPWLQRTPTVVAEDSLAQLSMWRLTGAMTRRAIETDRAEQLTLLSSGELLNQLLDAATENSGPLLRRAAQLGIHVENWNEVVDVEFANVLAVADDDAVTAYHYAQTMSRVAAQAAAQQDGSWAMAPRAGGVLLLRNRTHADGPAGLRRLRSSVQAVLDRAAATFPGMQVQCGIGGAHEGLTGLRASRAEAASALQTAQLRGAFGEPVLFDAPGLSRLLVEWYSSSSVRHSIDDLLAPLSALGPAKQREYGTTLRVYLENNRSTGRTAAQLYLHRNTVAYRITKVLDVLGIDLDDPNQFLALYLACYAQSMPHGARHADRAEGQTPTA